VIEQHSDRLSVLLVEDEVLMRLATAEDLRQAGITVLEAAHADEATMVLATHAAAIGVLLTDIQMPGSMDGAALVRLVRERYPRIRIVVLSGAGAKAMAGIPADAVMTKPHDPVQLVNQVSRLLESHTSNGSRSNNARSS
jgi:CheY-like chemotaxis protein